VISLDCEDTSGCREIGCDCEGAGSAMVCGYADILKDVSPDQEGSVAGKRIEGGGDTGEPGKRVEGVDQIDRGLSNRRGAESSTKEGDVLPFFSCGFSRVCLDGGYGEGYRGEVCLSGDRTLRSCSSDADGCGEFVDSDAMYGEVVEVRLEVFKVECEVEVVSVYEGGGFCFFGNACKDETGKGRRTEREHLAPALYDDVI